MSGNNPKKSGGFEDITSYSTPKGFKNRIKHSWNFKIKPFFLRNGKRNLKAILGIALCFVIIVTAAGGAWLVKTAGLLNREERSNPDATFNANETMEDNMNFGTISDIEDANSIKELLKSWATNGGDHIYSKRVVNILLVGEDDEDGTHRSDSTMLVSVNTKTKKITITSFLRDSYTYMNINGEERYCKTNHSYGWGGPSKLMEVLSNNYKIKIDKFVSINYKSFKNAIDALGGVTVPITEAEASFMNRTTKVKGFTSGDAVLLNGERALIYARIRKLDSEVERTRRQRELISSVIKNVKTSSLSELNTAIETFLPYVTTNLKTSEILAYGTQALSEGWMNYEIVSMVEPSEELRYGVRGFRTYTGYLDVWIVDYIKAARELQLALYNQTNIEIDPATHISAIELAKGSSSYSNSYDDTEYNNDYEADYYESTTRRSYWKGWEPEITLPDIDITIFNPLNPGTDETTQDGGYYEQTDYSGDETAPPTEYEPEPVTEPQEIPSTENRTIISNPFG